MPTTIALQKSSALDPNGIARCLRTGAEFGNVDPGLWTTVDTDPRSQAFFETLPEIMANLTRIPEYRTLAAATADPLNQMLRACGSDLRLDPWTPNPLAFGVVALLDLTVQWAKRAETTTLAANGAYYPAFTLGAEQEIRFLKARGRDEPVLVVKTKTSDVVYMTKLQSGENPEGLGIYELALTIEPKGAYTKVRYGSAVVPKVRLDVKPDINWLTSDVYHPAGIEIAQALQQIRFGLNEVGGRVLGETAMEMRGYAALVDDLETYHLDSPFMIWVLRQDVPLPLFMATVATEDWRDVNLGSL